jgi:hypothetical protein
VIVDLGVHVRVEFAEHRLPLLVLGGHVDLLEHQPDEAPEEVGVFLGEPQEPDDDPDRDVPGVLDGRVEARPALGLREQFAAQVPGKGSRAAVALGPKAGSSIPRAMAWKGGSDVIGGDNPIGAGRSSGPGRSSLTTTEREVKFSVS